MGIVDEQEKVFKPRREGECPKRCKKSCIRTQQRMECIYTGSEPKFGSEGDENPVGMFDEPEKYDVYSLCAPMPLALLPMQHPCRTSRDDARRRMLSAFLG